MSSIVDVTLPRSTWPTSVFVVGSIIQRRGCGSPLCSLTQIVPLGAGAAPTHTAPGVTSNPFGEITWIFATTVPTVGAVGEGAAPPLATDAQASTAIAESTENGLDPGTSRDRNFAIRPLSTQANPCPEQHRTLACTTASSRNTTGPRLQGEPGIKSRGTHVVGLPAGGFAWCVMGAMHTLPQFESRPSMTGPRSFAFRRLRRTAGPGPRRLLLASLLVSVVVTVAGCGGGSGSPWVRLRWSDDDAGWAPTGRWIVFASNRFATPSQGDESNGRYELYAMRLGGGGPRPLTLDAGCDDHDPLPSPDGREIAFFRYCGPGSGQDLMTVGSGGDGPGGEGVPRPLATNVESAAWSPGGRWMALVRTRDPADFFSKNDLWTVAADGGHLHRVARGFGGEDGSSIGGLAWSHDGGRIAFGCQGGSICIADTRTGKVRRIHRFSPWNGVSSVTWSRDDRELAFIDGSGGSYQPDYSAWVMSANGKHVFELPRYREGNVDGVAWLPTHRRTLVVNTDDAAVYLVHADGTDKRDLPFAADIVSASADGSRLLFVRRVFDSEGIYYRSAISLANLKTGQTRQLTQRRVSSAAGR